MGSICEISRCASLLFDGIGLGIFGAGGFDVVNLVSDLIAGATCHGLEIFVVFSLEGAD
jgi:hypothetical protein